MKKNKSKPGNPKAKKKVKWRDTFITAFAIISLSATLVWIVYLLYNQEPPTAGHKHRSKLPPPGVILDHRKVCMASNVYMGENQTTVTIDSQLYFSCSAHCTMQLQSSENVRVAQDPYTRKSVNKCKAFITMNPDSAGTILYFETEGNMKKYLNK